ncbi:MAG TPA: SDR family NAD(P)-dependent oxidoreductase [Solirubrobacteraceae bacterium]|nr:SDR family NAD(P)-dependent oxidoreductase [Solirubrobacteraceae bacterium]
MTIQQDGSPPAPLRGGALVTGGARGLGLEIARRLIARGHHVHVTDLDGELAARAAAGLGPRAFGSALDVRSFPACRAAASRTVRRAGSLEVWVNNAGVLVTGPAWQQDERTRALMLEVNATGTINGTLAALEPMRTTGQGHILNIVSLAGLVAAPGEAVYAASKHAAIGFSLATLADLRVAGINGIEISCVCPDGMWTPMLYDKLEDPSAAASFSGVLLRPEEVASEAVGLLDAPQPVLAIPRWRGVMMRAFDLMPALSLRYAPRVIARARRKQRRYLRQAKAGKL